jgi:hypothetical protein
VGFAHGQPPMTPAEAEQDHLARTLDRHPVMPVTSLPKRIAMKGLSEDETGLRLRQAELNELGEARAVGAVEEAIHAIRNARQFLAGSAEPVGAREGDE